MTTMIVIILTLAQFRFYSHGCLLLGASAIALLDWLPVRSHCCSGCVLVQTVYQPLRQWRQRGKQRREDTNLTPSTSHHSTNFVSDEQFGRSAPYVVWYLVILALVQLILELILLSQLLASPYVIRSGVLDIADKGVVGWVKFDIAPRT